MALADPSHLLDRLRALPGGEEVMAAIAAGRDDVYLVGGAVRDLWRGGAPVDLDLAVTGDLAPLVARLAGRDAAARAHARFGTALRGPGGVRCDLAATRRETYGAPGALPDVAPAGISEDLRRRDFTVNALALGLGGRDGGELLSVDHGLDDLGAGRLRVLHDESFRDDPTRLLRLARYAGRLAFTIDPRTESLAREAVGGGALSTVSGPRIGAELELLAHDSHALAGFAQARRLGIDAALAPGLGIADPGPVRRALAVMGLVGPHGVSPGYVVLAAALLGVADPDRRPLIDRLGLDRHLRRVVLSAAAGAPSLARRVPVDGPPSALLAVLPPDEPATIALAAGLGGPAVHDALARWLREYAPVRLAIDGGDLIRAGLTPGPIISVALRGALGARLDGLAPDRDAQLTAALRAAREGLGSLGSAMAVPAPFQECSGHHAIDLPGARAVFSTRRGGCSAEPYASLNLGFATGDAPAAQDRNRATLTGLLDAPPIAWMHQIHSDRVQILDDLGQGAERPECDGRATRLPGVALGALGADCLTVAIAGGGALAMVHAGWRGLAGGVLDRAVRAVRELAVAPVALAAAIGPGAGACCYEVGPEVHAAFAGVPGARRGDNLDLVTIARVRLAGAGVGEVHALGLCTICEPALYFSHRRDRGVTGRQAGLAWLT